MINIILSAFSTALTISVLIFLLLLFTKYFGDKFTAKCRYTIWIIVIARLCLPFGGVFAPKLVSFDLPISHQNINRYEFSAETTFDQSTTISSDSVPPDTSIPETEKILPSTVLAPTIQMDTDVKTDTSIKGKITLTNFFFTVWLAGAVIFFTVNLLSYNIFMVKIMRNKANASKVILDKYYEACSKLKILKRPRIYISDIITSPILCGYFFPTIIFPNIKYTDEGLQGILFHELIHYKRRDLWIKLLGVIANSLFFFNPLVYAARERLEREMELSCDEKLLCELDCSARLSYGTFMLEIVRHTNNLKSSLTTFYSPSKSAIKERFMNIINEKTRKHGKFIVVIVLILCTISGYMIGCSIENAENNEIISIFNDGEIINLTSESFDFKNITFQRKNTSSLAKYTPTDNSLSTFLKENSLYIMCEPVSPRYSNYFELMYENKGESICIYAGKTEDLNFKGKSFNSLLGQSGFCFSYYVSNYVDVYFSVSDNGVPTPFFKSTDGTYLVDLDNDGVHEIIEGERIYTTVEGKAVKFNIEENIAEHFSTNSDQFTLKFPYSPYNYVYSIYYNDQPSDDGSYDQHHAKLIYSKGKLTIQHLLSQHIDNNMTIQTSNKNWKMYKSMKYKAIILENGERCYGYSLSSTEPANSISNEFNGKKNAGFNLSANSYVYISKDETRAAVIDKSSFTNTVLFINLNTGDVIETISHNYKDILRFHNISEFTVAPYLPIYSHDSVTYATGARYSFDLNFEELDRAFRIIYTLKTNDEKLTLRGNITYNFSSYLPDEYEVIETTANGLENKANVYLSYVKQIKYSDIAIYRFRGAPETSMMLYTSDLEGNNFQSVIFSPSPNVDFQNSSIVTVGNYKDSHLLYMTLKDNTDMQSDRYFVYMANPETMFDSDRNPTKPLIWNYEKEIKVSENDWSAYEYGITPNPSFETQ